MADVELQESAAVAQQNDQLNGIEKRAEETPDELEEAEESISRLECFTCGLCRRRRKTKKAMKPRLEFREQPTPSTGDNSRQPTPLPAATKQDECADTSTHEVSEGPIAP